MDDCSVAVRKAVAFSICQIYEAGIQPSREESRAFEQAAVYKRQQLARRAATAEATQRWRRCLLFTDSRIAPETYLDISSGLKLQLPLPPSTHLTSVGWFAPEINRCPADESSWQLVPPRSRNVQLAGTTAAAVAAATATAKVAYNFDGIPLSAPQKITQPAEGNCDRQTPPAAAWPDNAGGGGSGGRGSGSDCPASLLHTFVETLEIMTRRKLPGDDCTDLFGLGCSRRRQFCWRFYLLPAPRSGSWQRFTELALGNVNHCELEIVDAFATRYACPAPEVVLHHWQHLWQTERKHFCLLPPSLDSLLSVLDRLGRQDLANLLPLPSLASMSPVAQRNQMTDKQHRIS